MHYYRRIARTPLNSWVYLTSYFKYTRREKIAAKKQNPLSSYDKP